MWWVAASKVFDEMWAQKVLAEDEAEQRLKRSASGGVNYVLVQLLPSKEPNKLEMNMYPSVCR